MAMRLSGPQAQKSQPWSRTVLAHMLELTAVGMWAGTSLCPQHNFELKKGNWECAEHALLLQPYPRVWAEVVVGFPSLVGIHGMNTSAPNTGSPLVPRLPRC